MKRDCYGKNAVVYVVAGHRYHHINQRVKQMLKLQNHFARMVLISPGDGGETDTSMTVRPLPNPTGVLRFLGLNKLKRLIDPIVFFPSRNMLYVSPVRRKLKRLVKRDLSDGKQVTVITTVPPHDLCEVGLFLKKRFPNIRWIVDWRDLWSYDENYFCSCPRFFRGRLLRLERKVLDRSDLNVVTNHYAGAILKDHYGVPSGRVVTVSHHFSGDQLPAPINEPKVSGDSQVIRVGFLGTLFKPPRVPGEKVLRAVQHARDCGLNVELHVFGDSSGMSKVFDGDMRYHWLFFYPRTNHWDSLEQVAKVDFLLLALENSLSSRVVMSIKLPHYLAVNLPIIAIVPTPSATADVIAETNAGFTISADTDWGEELKKLLQQALGGGVRLQRNYTEIEKYGWANVAPQWLSVINGANEDTLSGT